MFLQIYNGQASLIHLAISFTFLTLYVGSSYYTIVCQFYVNGSPVTNPNSAYISSERFSPPFWSGDDHLLFYPPGFNGGLWSGNIFSFAVYNKVKFSINVLLIF